MAHGSKGYLQALQKVNRAHRYPLAEALDLAVATARAKFDEMVEMAVRLGVDPRKADQNVRGAVVLPHGVGRAMRVIVFAKGEKIREAQAAGADYVGGEELVKKISEERWLEFDSAVATPDVMGIVGRLGKILGPRGLMPNPKVGTVTFEVGKAVQELKAGKVEYRVDKAGNVQAPIGKVSFGPQKLLDNASTLLSSLMRAKPPAARGTYLLGVTVTTTMGPGIKIDPTSVQRLGV